MLWIVFPGGVPAADASAEVTAVPTTKTAAVPQIAPITTTEVATVSTKVTPIPSEIAAIATKIPTIAAKAAPVSTQIAAVPASNVVTVSAINVRIAVKIIVVVDVHVVAAPAAVPAPAASPECAHGYAQTERYCHSCSVIPCRWIVDWRVGVNRSAVHHYRIIRGHIHDLRIGLFDHDDTLVLDNFRFHLLLLGRFQVAFVHCLFAHALHSVHYVALLRKERVPQIRGPLNVVCQAFHYVGKAGHRLDTWIPRLLGDGIGECLILQPRISREPLLELDKFKRISSCR